MTGNKDRLSAENGGADSLRAAEDISLSEVFSVLWRQQKMIFGIVFASAVVVIMVAFSLSPVYRSESVILPPRSLYVERLTVPDLYEITVDALYTRVVRNLRSRGLRYRFFLEKNLFEKFQGKGSEAVSTYKIFLKKFDEMIRVEKVSGKDKADVFVTVTMDGSDPRLLSVWLSDFINFVDEYTVQNVKDAILEKMHSRQVQLQAQIDGLRNIAKSRRLDRIARLEESATIAERLGISGDFKYFPFYGKERSKDKPVMVIGKDDPEYLRGSVVLFVEAETLKERKSDDPFIEGLRSLQEQLSSLEKRKVVPRGEVHALCIDQRAMTLEDPVQPNRILIIAIGLMTGLFFAVFVGFIKDLTDMKCRGRRTFE